jgi:hypothetical protein
MGNEQWIGLVRVECNKEDCAHHGLDYDFTKTGSKYCLHKSPQLEGSGETAVTYKCLSYKKMIYRTDERIERLLSALRDVAGLLNELTPQQIEEFDKAVKRRKENE